MEESRKQFEGWMADRYDTRLLRDGDKYMGQVVQSMWLSWQASRLAIEIELPTSYYGDRHCLDRREVTDAIISAGVKVKGA